MTDASLLEGLQLAKRVIEHELTAEPFRRVEGVNAVALLMDSGRENDKRPAYLKVAVPDEWVKTAMGAPELRDVFVLLKVPLETMQKVGREGNGA